MDSRWRIRLLGGVSAERGGWVVSRWKTYKVAALLARLAYDRDRRHPREELIEMHWSGCDPQAGRHSLSQALSCLRAQLEPAGVGSGSVILADRTSVQLARAETLTDVEEFEAALAIAEKAPGAERTRSLEAAVALYGGDLLPEAYHDWVSPERDRLRKLFLRATHRLVLELSEGGELVRAASFAHRAAASDPLCEEAQRDLMQLESSLGEPASALKRYRELERALEREVGVSPSPSTRELASRIERGAGIATRAAPPPTPTRTPEPSPRPHGTVTFVLLDPAPDPAVIAPLAAQCRGSGAGEKGTVLSTAFARPLDALRFALGARRALGPSARAAIDTGAVELSSGEYQGAVLAHAASLARAAAPGQVLCSEASAVLLGREALDGARIVPLGRFRLDEGARGEPLYEASEASGAPKVPSAPRCEGRLPLALAPFMGRDEQRAWLAEALSEGGVRLVTITGPGGIGKTRLAIEAARSELAQGPSVFFVPLADLGSASAIPDAIVDALEIRRAPGRAPIDEAVHALARRPTVLILDNFEHLVDEGAPIGAPRARPGPQVPRHLAPAARARWRARALARAAPRPGRGHCCRCARARAERHASRRPGARGETRVHCG